MTTRRTLLAAFPGLLMAPIVVRAMQPSLPESPLFPIIHGTEVPCRLLSGKEPEWTPMEIACFYSGSPAPRVQKTCGYKVVMDVLRAGGSPVSSVYEAEDVVLNTFKEGDRVVYPLPARSSCVGDVLAHPFVRINRAANLIAVRTRLGVGDMVFAHPQTAEAATTWSKYVPAWNPDSSPSRIGRWTTFGTVNGSTRVFVSEHMALGDVVVVMRDDTSSSFGAALFVDGGLSLGFMPNVEDYGVRYHFIFKKDVSS